MYTVFDMKNFSVFMILTLLHRALWVKHSFTAVLWVFLCFFIGGMLKHPYPLSSWNPKAKVMFTLHNKELLVVKRLKPVLFTSNALKSKQPGWQTKLTHYIYHIHSRVYHLYFVANWSSSITQHNSILSLFALH